MIDYTLICTMILLGSLIAGMVLMVNGVVQLLVRNKTGPWKDGGANFLAGIIVAGVSLGVMVWLGPRLIGPPG
jgi:fructose-1,6-bisphosphatase/inositol monophosphatase family enzyme